MRICNLHCCTNQNITEWLPASNDFCFYCLYCAKLVQWVITTEWRILLHFTTFTFIVYYTVCECSEQDFVVIFWQWQLQDWVEWGDSTKGQVSTSTSWNTICHHYGPCLARLEPQGSRDHNGNVWNRVGARTNPTEASWACEKPLQQSEASMSVSSSLNFRYTYI